MNQAMLFHDIIDNVVVYALAGGLITVFIGGVAMCAWMIIEPLFKAKK